MNTKFFKFLILLIMASLAAIGFIANESDNNISRSSFIKQQVSLDANNIKSYIWNSGVFDQNLVIQNNPGFEWPKGTGMNAVFTAGLTLGAYVNNQLRLATASYKGEYSPGYCTNGVFHTNSNFKLYKVTRGDNQNTNPDWLNWGLMVPYGAPFIDHNNNGIYEPAIDTPGVKSAAQTIFLCMTDADSNTHSNSEGFSGGTKPLCTEVHLTAWCYDNPRYQDIQFLKWVVINKNIYGWDSAYFSIYSDPDLGFSDDDYIGCDTVKNLFYCYNADNDDSGNSYAYGLNPPAVGFLFLNCNGSNARLNSFVKIGRNATTEPVCETEPSNPSNAYNYIKGLKRDGTPFLNAYTSPPQITKFCYSGDPETGSGWTEYTGKINNCGGVLTGNVETSLPGDRTFVASYGPRIRVNPNDTQTVQICQVIARGSNNKNSVTLLKQLSDSAKHLCETGFVIGITPISTKVPSSFALYHNYPNPFNPITKIKFDIPAFLSFGEGPRVRLTIYDALGREVATLVNEQLKPGTYEADWDGTNFPSGVYFYRLIVGDNTNNGNGDYSFTKKMVLIK